MDWMICDLEDVFSSEFVAAGGHVPGGRATAASRIVTPRHAIIIDSVPAMMLCCWSYVLNVVSRATSSSTSSTHWTTD